MTISARVRVVNDFGDMQFSKISNYIFDTFVLSFFFYQSKIIYRVLTMLTCACVVVDYADTCPCSQRPHSVSAVNDYADTRFFANFFSKTKSFTKPFLPVHMGPRSNLLSQKNVQKSRDTVPLIFAKLKQIILNLCF